MGEIASADFELYPTRSEVGSVQFGMVFKDESGVFWNLVDTIPVSMLERVIQRSVLGDSRPNVRHDLDIEPATGSVSSLSCNVCLTCSEGARIFHHGPECNTALHQEAGYMTATGYQPSEQRPCARGWVHTCQFESHSLHTSVSRIRESSENGWKSARVRGFFARRYGLRTR